MAQLGQEVPAWEGKSSFLFHLDLGGELLTHSLTLAHYLHIWIIHGFAFQLVRPRIPSTPPLCRSTECLRQWRKRENGCVRATNYVHRPRATSSVFASLPLQEAASCSQT